MIDLIPELIQHIVSFLNLEDCEALLCIKPWAEIITSNVLVLIDKTIIQTGNKFQQLHSGDYSRKVNSSERTGNDDADENFFWRPPYDVFGVSLHTTYTLEINKHEKKLYDDEFQQYVNMIGATKGYLYPYVVTMPCLIMEPRNPQDLVSELGEVQFFASSDVINWEHVHLRGISWEEARRIEAERKEPIFKVLKLMDKIKVDVYSMESGTRHENNFNYQIFMLMPDGTTFALELNTHHTEERYEMYNE